MGIYDFYYFMDEMEPVDLPMLSRKFTWSNAEDGNKWSRMDKFLLHPEWLEHFNFKQWRSPRTISNHCPILLGEEGKDWGPKPFKFLNAWVGNSSFLKVVENCRGKVLMDGWASFKWVKKLNELNIALRKWIFECFGNVQHKLSKVD